MINYNTIISNFNKRGTLLKWLKTLNEAVENGSLETVTTTTANDAVIFHFIFADGTTVDSPAIPLEAGPKGDKGDPGTPGAPGQDGEAATITVGTVTTLLPTQEATVTNVGTSSEAVFNFGIPKGEPGSATPTPIDNITDNTVTNAAYSAGIATIEKTATVEYTDQSTDSITATTLLPLSADGGHLNIAANNGAIEITDPLTDQIVYVEATTTASRAYSKYDYFVNNLGILVQATAAIAIGATIDSTNSSAVNQTLADEIAKKAKKAFFSEGNVSFSALCAEQGLISYCGVALDNLAADIANQNSGIIQLTSGGPFFHVVLFKYSNLYWSGYLGTYNIGGNDIYEPCYFVYANGTYKLARLITV